MRTILLATLTLASASAAHAAPRDVLGAWTGRYICGQGITKLNLDIQEAKNGKLTAIFRFSAPRENPNVPSGSYRMTGTFNERTRRIDLVGAEWIVHPFGYEMVDLRGHLTSDKSTLKGEVPFIGCSIFELIRPDQPIA